MSSLSFIISTSIGVFFIICSHKIFQSIKSVYIDPKLQWWKQKKRYTIETKCNYLLNTEKHPSEGNVQDLSQSGILITAPISQFLTQTPQLGDQVAVAFQCLLIPLTLTCCLIRIHKTETHLFLGCIFANNDKESLKKLDHLTSLLDQIGFKNRNQK